MTEPSETTAIVDINEPERIRMLTLGHPDVDNWREDRLDAADIVVNGVGIERKTPTDFASAMMEDRLDEQVIKLGEAFETAVILIEGGFDEFSTLTHTRLDPQSARGKAASIHTRTGIAVVPTGGTSGTETAMRLLVDYAVRLGRKATEEPSSGFLKSTVVGADQPLGKRLWGCFDGIGPNRAEALYEAMGSPTTFVRGDPAPGVEELRDWLLEVEGIGETTSQRVAEQLLARDERSPLAAEGSP